MGERTQVFCRWTDVLLGHVYEEWPDFKPIRGRLDNALKEMQSGECIYPVRLSCSHMTGRCRVTDGRHRILAAHLLGREKLLVEETWYDE